MIRLDGHQDQAGAWDVLLNASGALAFDVGANVGQSTKVLARNFRQVVALEPCKESYDILAAEMPDNVAALCLAASDVAGEVVLEEAATSISTGQLVSPGPHLSMWGETVGTRTVPATTLDKLVDRYGVPDFVKIDTEGHEVQVLQGAWRLFTLHRPRVIVEVHRAENGPLVREVLEGYELTELRHGNYVKPGGLIWLNHYWLHGEWEGV